MKNLLVATFVVLCVGLAAADEDVEFLEEEMVCDIPYEAIYAKCSIDEETAPEITESGRKMFDLEPYKAKGKFFINQKKGQLQLWLGREF